MALAFWVGMVRRFASMNGITCFRWKFSQFWAPAAVLWLSQLAYQPRAPPSGTTVIISSDIDRAG